MDHHDPSLTSETTKLRRDLNAARARNVKLADLLKEARDRLKDLSAEIDDLAEPVSTYGIFLEFANHRRDAEIMTAGRRMRVKISPHVDKSSLRSGNRVRLGEGSVIVESCGIPETGSLATLMEKIGSDRAVITSPSGEEKVVRLAEAIQHQARSGDSVLVHERVGVAFERIPKTEVSSLSLEEVPDVSYADIGGLDEQIDKIRDAVELPFAHPELYKAYQLHPPKGVLLYGPPGCGKTLIAKAVAQSLATRIGDGSRSWFLNIKGPELLNKFVGETERRIRMIFERARELASEGRPVIIFFDEIDSIFRTRGSGVSSDMETTVVPQLLTELDGVENLRNVIIIGATNREELIDPAVLRPGRLDVKIRISRPDEAGAKDIFSRYIDDSLPLVDSAETLINTGVSELFRDKPYVRLYFSEGSCQVLHYRDFVSGAMIANIVDRAKKLAIKDAISAQGRGLTTRHMIAAVAAEQSESEDLPNTANPDEWARITGRPGRNVLRIEVIG
ncbi:proteasome ATPase [Corynebacterium poyangense]|uniref:AAA ATPase forming ring-shaped complexes n=1 Tax=Corynebacterium poyangense TaxID=2684405 RepID=A0A7H0SNU7_9CORY|nr:proteasome ATPase [Corynebacterium poyangense]MBZ8177777.1 proteasome ATPase [Corynebacterium poyangense]QNQ90222.1 proteasome ATPase [Corynebacterium poyangense]